MAFIAACAATGELDINDDVAENLDVEDEQSKARGAAGWVIFVGLMAMIVEGIIIALRFLNFRLINLFITIFYVVVCSTQSEGCCLGWLFIMPPWSCLRKNCILCIQYKYMHPFLNVFGIIQSRLYFSVAV